MGFAALALFRGHNESIGYTAAVLSLIALIYGWRKLPETRRFEEAPPTPRRGVNLAALRVMTSDRVIGPIVLTFFLATLGFAAFETTLALLLKEVVGLSKDQLPLMFAYVGLVLVLTQGFLYRRMARKLSEVAFMVIGLLFMAAGVGLLALVCHTAMNTWLLTPSGVAGGMELVRPSVWFLLVLALTVSVMGFAFLTPSAQALISRRSDASQQGEVLGVNQSAAALARILGPIFGVTLYKVTNDHMLPYVFGGILLLLMLPMMPRIRRGEPVSSGPSAGSGVPGPGAVRQETGITDQQVGRAS
jgi:hypothetical protein